MSLFGEVVVPTRRPFIRRNGISLHKSVIAQTGEQGIDGALTGDETVRFAQDLRNLKPVAISGLEECEHAVVDETLAHLRQKLVDVSRYHVLHSSA